MKLLYSIFLLLCFCFLYSEAVYPKTSKVMVENIPLIVKQYGAVAPGNIYGTLRSSKSDGAGIMEFILSENGKEIVFSKKGNFVDLKKHPNGLLSSGSCYINSCPQWHIMNENFETVYCFNGMYYKADFHDFLILRNGNFLILTSYQQECENPTFINDVLSQWPARLRHLKKPLREMKIQEITLSGDVVFTWDCKDHLSDLTDQAGKVVFTWDCKDYYSLYDLTDQGWEQAVNLGGPIVFDYLHCNALEEDVDGNILLSIRHFSQIIKIDRKTGDIIWRLGGPKSDFTFVNDPLNGFYCQHCPTLLENNHILLYDNGNYHKPKNTRIVEYKLDEDNRTATLVWEYSNDRFTATQGSAQRLKNGNTLIGWGGKTSSTTSIIEEVTPDKKTVLEIFAPSQYSHYRVYKFE